jgi:hypothetical protein
MNRRLEQQRDELERECAILWSRLRAGLARKLTVRLKVVRGEEREAIGLATCRCDR